MVDFPLALGAFTSVFDFALAQKRIKSIF